MIAALFYALWLSDAIPASLAGQPAQSLIDAGTPTNFVQVLDMAWLLPALVITAVNLWRKQPIGYTLAGALLTWVARSRLGSRSLGLAGRRRLAIVENAVIDARTRVVLIRRDDAEHLIVVGSAGISTIETAIRSGVPATAGVKAEP